VVVSDGGDGGRWCGWRDRMRERRQQNRRMPTRGRDDDGGGGAKGRRCGQWIGRDESHRDKEREREEGALRIRENNTT